MEIKAELLKPYSKEEKRDFISSQNHNLCYKIKEPPMTLEVWEYTEEAERLHERNVIDMPPFILSLFRGNRTKIELNSFIAP